MPGMIHIGCCCRQPFIASGIASVMGQLPAAVPITEHYHSGVTHRVVLPAPYSGALVSDLVIGSDSAIHGVFSYSGKRYHCYLPLSQFANATEVWQDITQTPAAPSGTTDTWYNLGCADNVPAYVTFRSSAACGYHLFRKPLGSTGWQDTVLSVPSPPAPFRWERRYVYTDNRVLTGGIYVGDYVTEQFWCYPSDIQQSTAGTKCHHAVRVRFTYAKTTARYDSTGAVTYLYDNQECFGCFLITCMPDGTYTTEMIYDWSVRANSTNYWSSVLPIATTSPWQSADGTLYLLKVYSTTQGSETPGTQKLGIKPPGGAWSWHGVALSSSTGTFAEHPDGSVYYHFSELNGSYIGGNPVSDWHTKKWNPTTLTFVDSLLVGEPAGAGYYYDSSGRQIGSWTHILQFDVAGNWQIFHNVLTYSGYYQGYAELVDATGSRRTGGAGATISPYQQVYYVSRFRK